MYQQEKRWTRGVEVCLGLAAFMTANVSKAEPGSVILEVDPARGYSSILGSQGEATLQFTLHEKEGRPVLLPPPVLARVVHKDVKTGETGFQVLAEARFLDLKGQPIEAPFLLEGGKTLPLRLVLSGLPGPGRYEGTIRLGAVDAQAVDLPFVLYLRDRPVVAFVLIALGAVLSFFVRKYAAHERPRMVLQQRALKMARMLEDLRASPELSVRGRELLAAIAHEKDWALADIADQAVSLSDSGTRVEFLERKVVCTRNWLRLCKAVEEMRPVSLRAEPRAKLDQVERSLRNPRATPEEISATEAALAGIPSEMEAGLRALEAARAAQSPPPADPGASGPEMVSFSSEEPGETPAGLFEGMQLFIPKLEGKPAAEGLAQIEKRLLSLDLFILALVLGVAALGGMKILWMDVLTWGSLNDHLIAFMWGFGMHQVCHPGLAGMLGRSKKQPGPE